jgi:hypothetical protein
MFKILVAIFGAIALAVGCFMAGVTWTTMPGPVKSQQTDAKPAVPKKVIDDQDEAMLERHGALNGFEKTGVVKQYTRQKQDLNLFVGPLFKTMDQKSRSFVCETAYAYMMTMPAEYKLSEYNETLKLHDGDTQESIGTFSGKTGLRLKEQPKSEKK